MRLHCTDEPSLEISQFMPDSGRDLLSEICIQISDTGLILTSRVATTNSTPDG
jgi:hypothetical protein